MNIKMVSLALIVIAIAIGGYVWMRDGGMADVDTSALEINSGNNS